MCQITLTIVEYDPLVLKGIVSIYILFISVCKGKFKSDKNKACLKKDFKEENSLFNSNAISKFS